MPYEAVRDDRCPASKPWGTVNANDHSLLGCHETQERALAQGRAAMANESAKEDTMKTDHKGISGCSLKVVDDAAGIVEAIVSVTGVVDNVDDNILPGAYEKTLTARTPKGVWSHDWDEPIAKTLEATELMPGDSRLPADILSAGGGGLLIQSQFNLETERGRNAYSDVKFFGDEAQWSIGYKVPTGKSRVDKKTGVREIEEIDLYEYSPVLFGAMPMAGTVSVKSLAVDIAKELSQDDDPDDALIKAAGVAYLTLLGKLDEAEEADEKIQPHEFVDDDEDGLCDICDLPEDECVAKWGDGADDGEMEEGEKHDTDAQANTPAGQDATKAHTGQDAGAAKSSRSSTGPPPASSSSGEVKEGRVLSGANRSKVTAAVEALQALLAASEPREKGDEEPETPAEKADLFILPEADILRFEQLKRV